MKSIAVNDKPYLERYYLGGLFGYQIWLHRFRSADGDRHLHSHPWSALSVVLAGWYREEALVDGLAWYRLREAFGLPSLITPARVHRIAEVAPETWTLMIVGRKRKPLWHFIDGDKREDVVTSARDWWRDASPRRETLDQILTRMSRADDSRGAIQAIQREYWLRHEEWVFIGRGR